MEKVTFKFLSGADQNKEISLEANTIQKITVGRDPTSTIVISEREDMVSRLHAEVSLNASGEALQLRDRSSNGVFVNHKQIVGEMEVGHDDQVQLGKNGPIIQIIFDPAPVKATRIMNAIDVKATRIVETPKTSEAAIKTPSKSGIGAETLERRIGEATDRVKTESGKKLINVAVLGLSALVLIGGFFFYRSKTQDDVLQAQNATLRSIQDAPVVLDPGMASSIRQNWTNSTVRIDATWVLINRETDQTIFHVHETRNGQRLPVYVEMPDGAFRPYLSVNATKGYPVIGGQRPGTGFIISENGFIASAANVVAGWRAPFQFKFPGWVKRLSGKYELMEEAPKNLLEWVPERDGYFLLDKEDKDRSSRFTGKNLQLYVTFPNSSLKIPAAPGVVSNKHDVGLIKIDVAQKLAPVQLNNEGHVSRKAGDALVLLGYPGLSIKTYLDEKGQSSGGKDNVNAVAISDVSVNQGIISKVVPRAVQSGEYALATNIGDYIEMSMNISSSQGIAGGPIFDSKGRVTALYYNDISLTRSGSAGSIALGIPVEYVIELMDPTRAVVK
jgi:serine protease Do